MTLDPIVAVVASGLFVGWFLIVVLAFSDYLATSYIHHRIVFLQDENPNAANTELESLRRWEDKCFPANLGFVLYHIGRRIGWATCQEVVELVEVTDLMVCGLFLLCG